MNAYIVSRKVRRAVTLHPDISHLDGGLNTNKRLSYLSNSCHDSFWLLNMAKELQHKGPKEVIYEPRIVPQKGVDSDIYGNSSNVERTDKNVGKNNNFPDKTCDCA